MNNLQKIGIVNPRVKFQSFKMYREPVSPRRLRQNRRLNDFFEKYDVHKIQSEIYGKGPCSTASVDGLCTQLNQLSLDGKGADSSERKLACIPDLKERTVTNIKDDYDSANVLKAANCTGWFQNESENKNPQEEEVEDIWTASGQLAPHFSPLDDQKSPDLQVLNPEAIEFDLAEYQTKNVFECAGANSGEGMPDNSCSDSISSLITETNDSVHSSIEKNKGVVEHIPTESFDKQKTRSSKIRLLFSSWRKYQPDHIFNVTHFVYENGYDAFDRLES